MWWRLSACAVHVLRSLRYNSLMKTYKAYIFDMDGTVLDTLTDLNDALNHALKEHGHFGAYTGDETRHFFGSGVLVALARVLFTEQVLGLTPETVRTSSAPLMEKDFPLAKLYSIGTEQDEITATLDRAEIDRISATYRPWYNAHCEIATGPYPGIVEAVRDLRNLGIRTSVVSNKPDAAVQKLSEQYFPGLFDFSIGEQEPLFRRKPAPDMVLAAAQKLGCSLEDSVYVGDSEVDLETARACGMDFLCVTWGFRTRSYLEGLGVTSFAETPEELLP